MPWRTSDIMDERVSFVVRANQSPLNFSALCREFGVSRPTGYRWLKRYQQVRQLSLLEDRSCRPHHSPSRTPSELERRVVELRKLHGWGAKKLRVKLVEQGIDLGPATINRIIRRNGLLDPRDSHQPAINRFEREHPNELWQMDFKGQFKTEGSLCHPLVILDDHSRFVVGLHALPSQAAGVVSPCLVQAFERYGVPQAMLMDHGVPWWSTTNGHGLTTVSVQLIKQGIYLIYGAVRHPQTLGKVERFNRTLKQAARRKGKLYNLAEWTRFLDGFSHEYNYVRPHEALEMAVPASRYHRSPRQYDPHPRPWEYPPGSIVKRLNSQGSLDYCASRYFVCEALAGEQVRIEPFGRRLLITYRHMHIREIDTQTGCSFSIVRPVRESHV